MPKYRHVIKFAANILQSQSGKFTCRKVSLS